MLKIIAEDFIHPEHIDKVMPLYAELVRLSKQEAQCIAYDLFVDQKEPGHFVFIEEWPDQAALDLHCKTEHFTRLVPQIDQYRRAEGRFTHLKAFA